MKHTVGPWEFKKDKIVQANSSNTESNVIAYNVLPHNGPILAAAPDMLEALEAVFRQTCTLGVMPDQNCKKMMAGAITKAKGKS